MKVTETLQRDRLWAVQTPQVFKKDVIVQAHRRVASGDPSDDALLVEQAGMVVTVVMGDYENIKVTHPHDVAVAEAFLKTRAMSGKI